MKSIHKQVYKNKLMQKHIILLSFFFFATLIKAQNVDTARNINKPKDLRVEFPVAEITTNMTFYNPSGSVEKKREVSVLNQHHYVVLEHRYDEENTLTVRLTRLFDSSGIKSLGRKIEHWHKIIGYSFEVNKHEYDEKGFLIKTIEKNQNQQITMITAIKNDEFGNAIEVSVTNGRGDVYGVERATYDYVNNSVTNNVYNNKEELLSTTTSKINYDASDDKTIIKNEQGDVIKTSLSEYDYRYDKKNNWISMIRYSIENGKRIKRAEFYRKINYRK